MSAHRLWRFSFVVLMLALMAVCAGLGVWQLERLGEKEALIAAVESRADLPAMPLPPVAAWGTTDWDALTFRKVAFTGRFLPEGVVHVFTSLSEARGTYRGPGYWIMLPVALEGGGTLIVNRGFVPQERGTTADLTGLTDAPVTLEGVVQRDERAGAFTPEPDPANRVDWARDIARMSRLASTLPQPVAPVFVDLPATTPGALPQGGETIIAFPNNHLGYAITWFGFAVLIPILLIFWLRRGRRPPGS